MHDLIFMDRKYFQLLAFGDNIPARHRAMFGQSPTFRMKMAHVSSQAQKIVVTSQGMIFRMLTDMKRHGAFGISSNKSDQVQITIKITIDEPPSTLIFLKEIFKTNAQKEKGAIFPGPL